MPSEVLKNKPLVEAIFEFRWALHEEQPGILIDPHYPVLVGMIYEKVQAEYPYHEKLPTASLPDAIAGYVVQHRFRTAEKGWPLIQIGAGIMTMNDTHGYTWDGFKESIIKALHVLFDIYPESKDLRSKNIALRYIDAIDFDYEKDNVMDFLKENMHVGISLRRDLFDDTGILEVPSILDLRLSFPCQNPNCAVSVRFFKGERDNKEALLWETVVESIEGQTPNSIEDIIRWTDEAHSRAHEVFFLNIEGKLRRRFE